MSLFSEMMEEVAIKYDGSMSYAKTDDIEKFLNSRGLGGIESCEEAIAEGIISGSYSQKHAKLVCELEGMDWNKVDQEYNKLYAAEQVAGANSWN